MKTVYLGLTGDIIHPGIINIIREGAARGKLIAGVLTDRAIAAHKRLPYLTFDQRCEVVGNLKGVAEVVPQDEWSYVPNLRKYKPDIIIHGDDWLSGPLSKIREEVFAVMREQGGEVVEIPYTKGITSTALNEEMRAVGTTPEVRMKTLRRLLHAKPFLRILEAHSGLSGLIIEKLSVEAGDGLRFFDGMWSSSLTDSVYRLKNRAFSVYGAHAGTERNFCSHH